LLSIPKRPTLRHGAGLKRKPAPQAALEPSPPLGKLGITDGLNLRLGIEAKIAIFAAAISRRDNMAAYLEGL
jgi:hypothetical protein